MMNLFLVTSPLQYLCALEAKTHFQCEQSILVLISQKSEHGLAQQNALFQPNEWQHIIQIERGNRSFSIPSVIKKVKRIIGNSPLSCFFYAEYNAWWTKLLIRNLPIEKECYFDDGTLTLLEYSEYITSKKSFYRPRLLQDFLVRSQRCQPVGRLPQSDNLHLFTFFELPPSHVKIHKNNFSRLKQTYGCADLYSPNAPIGFIGQGAVGDKRQKTTEQYLHELEQLSEHLQQKILYFPHRTEKQEVTAALKKADYITYYRNEYPLEIELIDKHIQLSALVGMFSTVMFTARTLYPKMPIYSLSSTHPNKTFQKRLEEQMQTINVQPLEHLIST
ncbi:hypothetical protein ATG66_3790 [Vibrio sp. ES.051]|uniref:glycosyltransferase 52 family protein n=1 Tax=Vibrio sp. ES.051 TaxID=1761909 RepID=UPI000C01A957|nr:glycosyltransferase 52 family protein [Vibrio sp. ES.051]PFG45497.1 hypothetical protein ATG66_3790 [Vibrio sp. ES.051]